MHTYASLTSIAQYEFDALLQDTAAAIRGLECQRRSAMHAIRAAQQAGNQAMPDMGLADKLGRLSAALDQVACELEA